MEARLAGLFAGVLLVHFSRADQGWSAGYHHGAPIPQDIMADVINNLGLALLQVRKLVNNNQYLRALV